MQQEIAGALSSAEEVFPTISPIVGNVGTSLNTLVSGLDDVIPGLATNLSNM